MGYFRFYFDLEKQDKENLILYMVDGKSNKINTFRNGLPEDLSAVLALRGMIGFGIF